MAETTSPYTAPPCAAPYTAALELSATPGTVLEIRLPQNARRMVVSLHNTSHHPCTLSYVSGGAGVPIGASESLTLPALSADQRVYLSSTHVSPTFTLHCALRD